MLAKIYVLAGLVFGVTVLVCGLGYGAEITGVKEISIVLPYAGVEKEVRIWSMQEGEIDFRGQPDLAARCTASFAATELGDYLEKTLAGAKIRYDSERPANGFFIELSIKDPASRKDSFAMGADGGGVVIRGDGRTGLLYGAYEFLRMQGWRWYAPGKEGEIAPAKRETLVLPEGMKVHAPSMSRGRGFYLEYVSEESSEFCLWMARNRLNVVGYRPATGALSNKLGMMFNVGGHIFEKILDPERVMPSGKILWDEHREWYGLPENGQRIQEKARKTQFCVSQADLMEFLGAELLKRVMGEWKDADLVEVWGFDTWGSTCTCAECKKLGNSTDQMLHFLSALRGYLTGAKAEGRLDHDLHLSGCSYEGTNSLEGPAKAIPANLIEAGDVIVYYPINRCYAHSLYDAECADNVRYQKALASWFAGDGKLDVFFGEYYNVSKYEDLPLLFTATMRKDIPGHYATGCRGITYMHVPFVNWSVRTLTQALYAQLAWDAETDPNAFLDEYFTLWYGPFAERMRGVYTDVEEGWKYISQWRNWDSRSVLHQFLRWDGSKPKKSIAVPEHFGDAVGAIESGKKSAEKLRRALETVESMQKERRSLPPYEGRLGEDRRALRYGVHTMELMTALVEYHEALYREDIAKAEEHWREIERVADLLESYWVPIGYASTGQAGIRSLDGLTRTQVRDLVRDCRTYRKQGM